MILVRSQLEIEEIYVKNTDFQNSSSAFTEQDMSLRNEKNFKNS